jgi:hypothetical protein
MVPSLTVGAAAAHPDPADADDSTLQGGLDPAGRFQDWW